MAQFILGSILALLFAFSQFLKPTVLDSINQVELVLTGDAGAIKLTSHLSSPSIILQSFPRPVRFNVQTKQNVFYLLEIFIEKNIDEPLLAKRLTLSDYFPIAIFRVSIFANAP